MKGRVMVVEDDESLRDLVVEQLRRRGYDARPEASAIDALAHLADVDPDVLITDLRLGGMDGTALCRRVAVERPDVPVIVMTAFGSVDAAIGAIRAGAYDFLTKPFETDALLVALERALEHRALTREVRRLRTVVARAEGFEQILGESPRMRSLADLLARIADTDSSVLITGESGTGKELAARALHARSRRREGPFVAVNCAAVPATLLESELFGHVRGAYTDARTARPGLVLKANGGTLFLDEIGDMPAAVQPHLLRVLQERRVRPVGGDDEIPVDIRLVSATNQDLEEAVASGRFREDLLYRIDVIRVEMPPLRERGNDILLLAQHFLDTHAARLGRPVRGMAPGAAALLLGYPWPGNVRELNNAIERAVALASHDQLTADDLPPKVRKALPFEAAGEGGALLPLAEVEKRHILRVLDACGGRRVEAARVLGLDRKTLYRRLKEFGVAAEE